MSPRAQPSVPSLANRLPPEIIAEIFAAATIRSSSVGSYHVLLGFGYSSESTSTPVADLWTLALVSKYWCQIVFSSPQLWAKFCIDLTSISPQLLSHGISPTPKRAIDVLVGPLFPALELCLMRSQDHPLHFIIKARDNGDGSFSYVTNVLALCLKHESRWEDVTLGFPVQKYDRLLVPTKQSVEVQGIANLPRLRRLCFQGGGVVFPRSRPSSFIKLFQHGPALSVLDYYCPIGTPRTLLQDLPLFQITRFSLMVTAEHSFRDFFSLSHLMPNLTNLSLLMFANQMSAYWMFDSGEDANPSDQAYSDSTRHGGQGIAQLPSLQNLSLKMVMHDRIEPLDLSFVFDCLPCTPALKSLELHEFGETDDYADALGRFIRRSRCDIQTLCSGGDSHGAITLLETFPDIQSITFSGTHFDEEFIRCLMYPSLEPIVGAVTILTIPNRLATRVQRMVIEDPHVYAGLGDLFVEMLASRLRFGGDGSDDFVCRLAHLDITIPGVFGGTELHEFISLVFCLFPESIPSKHKG